MVNRIRTVNPCGSNKVFNSRFCVNSWVWHETPEESRGTCRPKFCDNKNKNVVNSTNILSWLVGWVLWHINLWRLTPDPFLCKKQFSLVWVHSLIVKKTFLFQTIRFSQTVLIRFSQTVLTGYLDWTDLFNQFSQGTQFRYQNSSISSSSI